MSITMLQGVRTVAAHEFRVRLRTGRWRVLLALWFVALAGQTALMWWAAKSVDQLHQRGVPVFGGLMLLLLSLSLLVLPSLSAQSVNGDRERGVLATLQVTLLTPAEIALGKLAAAWGVSLVFLLLALPMAVSTLFMGGVGVTRLLVTLLVVAVLLGVVLAIAQCWSALFARTGMSSVLSYLSVFALTIGTLIVFGLALPSTEKDHEVRTEKVWWLLAPNPFVILADAAPQKHQAFTLNSDQKATTFDPLGGIASAVRDARDPNHNTDALGLTNSADQRPVWPWGLAFDALLGLSALSITIRRLRTPSRRLPRGVRVA